MRKHAAHYWPHSRAPEKSWVPWTPLEKRKVCFLPFELPNTHTHACIIYIFFRRIHGTGFCLPSFSIKKQPNVGEYQKKASISISIYILHITNYTYYIFDKDTSTFLPKQDSVVLFSPPLNQVEARNKNPWQSSPLRAPEVVPHSLMQKRKVTGFLLKNSADLFLRGWLTKIPEVFWKRLVGWLVWLVWLVGCLSLKRPPTKLGFWFLYHKRVFFYG